MQDVVLQITYFERGLLKSHKKVNLIFPFESNPFNGQDHKKQKRSVTSDMSLIRLQNKFRKIP